MGSVWAPAHQNRIRSAPSPNPQGAKFAWESAGSGLEVCPEDIYGTQEIHINGAVVLAFQLYYHSTQVRCHCAHQVCPCWYGHSPHTAGTSCLEPDGPVKHLGAVTSGHVEGWALVRNVVSSGN